MSIYSNDKINKINYNNIPQTTFEEVKYRDLTSSDFFNKNQKSILNDILDLFNKANVIESSIIENSGILEYESNYSNMKIKRLENEIENLKSEFESISYNKEYYTKYIYPSNLIKSSSVQYDDSYNCITLTPKLYEPKTYVVNDLTNEVLMPVNVPVNLSYENINKDVDIIRESSNSIQNIFDGKDNTYWYKSITLNNSFNKVIASLEFELPESIITSRSVNELLVKLYPSDSIDILNIEYKTTSGSYEQIPNYQNYCINQNGFNVGWNYDTEDFEIIDANSLKLNFDDIQVHKIKITISQKYYVVNNDSTRTFVIGFKGIDVRQNFYNDEASVAKFIIKFPSNKSVLFNSITPVFTNDTQINTNKIKFEFYHLYPDGKKVKILNKAPFDCVTQELYVECFIKANRCTPNILKFKYDYKYLR